ncbi:MAG TPA: hypothetical protein VHU23_09135 [Rhizomicrobium sp.]|jgi:hypothetical protein|nr:hypothetical protein [Rhizomicrobium sp.]
MGGNFAERERQTNRLVRAVAAWLFSQKHIQPVQLFGLVWLTWTTASHVNEDTYVRSVKIPALGQIFGRDYSRSNLAEAAQDVSRQMADAKVEALVMGETGFSNIYNAYRNSSFDWMRAHFRKVLPIAKAAYHLKSDVQGRSLAERIDDLPQIRKPDQPSVLCIRPVCSRH